MTLDGRQWPRISIITPSYNQGAFIECAIRSILLQDYPNLELIINDGGSTDETVATIGKYENWLASWRSGSDRGQSHAINMGIENSTGELIAYLNCDDLYLPGALDVVARAVRENPDGDLFYGRCRTIDEAARPLSKVYSGEISSAEEILDLWDVWWSGRNFVQPEVFWTRRIMEKVGPFREDLHYAMDYDYWCRCFLAGAKAVRIDADLAAFRVWDAQKSKAVDAAAGELREVVCGHLSDEAASISYATRTRLRARLAFDTEFLPLVARSVKADETRLRRWWRIAKLLFGRPQIAFSRPLWRRVGIIVSARLQFRWAFRSGGFDAK